MAEDNSTFLVGKRFPNRLFVGGLPPSVSATELADFFTHFAGVIDSKIICDEMGTSKGYGFVTFKSVRDVKKVCAMGTLFLRNKKLNIGPAVKKEGPTIQPEMVIVPSAPSKGEYYYPAMAQMPQQAPMIPTQYEPQMYSYPSPTLLADTFNNNNNIGYYPAFPCNQGMSFLPMEVPCHVMIDNTQNQLMTNMYTMEPQPSMEDRRNTKKHRSRQNLPPRLQTKRSN